MKKQSMKEKVLNFVESKGEASFTEIQRFIVDHNYGEGTYDASIKSGEGWKQNPQTGEWKREKTGFNPFRGYYCSAFCRTYTQGPQFMEGRDRLEKGEGKRGKYKVIRNSEIDKKVPLIPYHIELKSYSNR